MPLLPPLLTPFSLILPPLLDDTPWILPLLRRHKSAAYAFRHCFRFRALMLSALRLLPYCLRQISFSSPLIIMPIRFHYFRWLTLRSCCHDAAALPCHARHAAADDMPATLMLPADMLADGFTMPCHAALTLLMPPPFHGYAFVISCQIRRQLLPAFATMMPPLIFLDVFFMPC